MTSAAIVKDMIEEELGRGPNYHSDLFFYNRMLMQIHWLERNHTLRYMKRFIRLTIFANSNVPGPYALPQNAKSFDFIRATQVGADNSVNFAYMTKIEPGQVTGYTRGVPRGYWLDSDQWLWFDSIPTEDVVCEAYYAAYSGPIERTDEHWLFNNGLDYVLSSTLEYLFGYHRMPNLQPHYSRMKAEAVRTLLLAEEEGERKSTSVRLGELADV